MLFRSDKGIIKFNGDDFFAKHQANKSLIGIVPQDIALYDELSILDNLIFWGQLYNVSRKELKDKIELLLKTYGFSQRRHDKVKTLSGGMKRSINILATLIHDPILIIFDEPTAGLDLQSRENIYDAILELKKAGKTIIYTTHYLEEAERLCDNIFIIEKGRIIASGTLKQLLDKYCDVQKLTITLNQEFQSQNYNRLLTDYPDLLVSNDKLTFFCKDADRDLLEIVRMLLLEKIHILKIEIQAKNLESVFLSLTKKQISE